MLMTGRQAKAAYITRERILATLQRGAGKQSTPFRNSCCQIAITMIRLEKERPLTASEAASYHAAIRGLQTTLPGGKGPPLTVQRRDDRTDQQKMNDKAIRDLYADTNRRPSWDLDANRSDAVDNTPSMDPELQARGWGKGWEGRPMADCPVKPTSEAIVNLNHQRPDYPVIWADGTPRGIVAKFVSWALNAQDNH